MNKGLMDVLYGIRDDLDEMVLGASPSEVAGLAGRRDQVSALINQLIELDYKGTAEGLDQATQDLGALRGELAAAKGKADTVSTAISVAGKVAGVVASVVGAVA